MTQVYRSLVRAGAHLAGLAALGFGLLATAAAQTPAKPVELDPKTLAFKLPADLKWRDPADKAGVNSTVLLGDPEKPGLYIVLNKFKPGNFSRPHFHPNDRHITVVKGTWWIATGNHWDKDKMVAMPMGSHVTHYGKQVHWDGAKDEEAWVLIVGEGPGTSTPVEIAK